MMEVIKIYKKQNNENVELRDFAQDNRMSAAHSSQTLDLGNSTLDLTMGLGGFGERKSVSDSQIEFARFDQSEEFTGAPEQLFTGCGIVGEAWSGQE